MKGFIRRVAAILAVLVCLGTAHSVFSAPYYPTWKSENYTVQFRQTPGTGDWVEEHNGKLVNNNLVGSYRNYSAALYDTKRGPKGMSVHLTPIEAKVYENDKLVRTYIGRWEGQPPPDARREVYIQSASHRLNLDADTTTKGNGAKVQLWQSNGAPQQKWRLRDAGHGRYFIQSVNNNLYLDANPKTKGNGAQVYLWEFNGSVWQKWLLKDVPGQKGSLGSGLHYIQAVSSGLYLDANPRTKGNGAQVYLWQFNGHPQQRWSLMSTGTPKLN